MKRWINQFRVNRWNKQMFRVGFHVKLFVFEMTNYGKHTGEKYYYSVSLYASPNGRREYRVHAQEQAPRFRQHPFFVSTLEPWRLGVDSYFSYKIRKYYLDDKANIRSKIVEYGPKSSKKEAPKPAGKVVDLSDFR